MIIQVELSLLLIQPQTAEPHILLPDDLIASQTVSQLHKPLGIVYNHRLDDFITLLRAVKHMPYTFRNTLKRLLKSLRLVLLLNPNSRYVCDFANENKVNPTRVFIVSNSKSWLASPRAGDGVIAWYVHFAVGLRIRLRRVSNTDHLPLWYPRVDLDHAVNLVFLCPESEIRQKAGQITP